MCDSFGVVLTCHVYKSLERVKLTLLWGHMTLRREYSDPQKLLMCLFKRVVYNTQQVSTTLRELRDSLLQRVGYLLVHFSFALQWTKVRLIILMEVTPLAPPPLHSDTALSVSSFHRQTFIQHHFTECSVVEMGHICKSPPTFCSHGHAIYSRCTVRHCLIDNVAV